MTCGSFSPPVNVSSYNLKKVVKSLFLTNSYLFLGLHPSLRSPWDRFPRKSPLPRRRKSTGSGPPTSARLDTPGLDPAPRNHSKSPKSIFSHHKVCDNELPMVGRVSTPH